MSVENADLVPPRCGEERRDDHLIKENQRAITLCRHTQNEA